MKVPWLAKHHIEKQAVSVISNHELRQGVSITPPIPVEMIAEQSLGLQLSYDDLRARLGMDDVLGATYVRLKRICIDESLLDDEVRLNFTCSHEIGHWVLHRNLITFGTRSKGSGETIFCRTKDAFRPIEWQSDYFAACLLMPETAVVDAWNKTFGPRPLILYNARKSMRNGPLYFDPCAENWHLIASSVCQAGGFTNCSKQSMMIRLTELGLVQNRSGVGIGTYQSYS